MSDLVEKLNRLDGMDMNNKFMAQTLVIIQALVGSEPDGNRFSRWTLERIVKAAEQNKNET